MILTDRMKNNEERTQYYVEMYVRNKEARIKKCSEEVLLALELWENTKISDIKSPSSSILHVNHYEIVICTQYIKKDMVDSIKESYEKKNYNVKLSKDQMKLIVYSQNLLDEYNYFYNFNFEPFDINYNVNSKLSSFFPHCKWFFW